MAEPLNPKALQQLEGELAQAQKRGDHLEALDILEDIHKRGWAQAKHMLALGECYMHSRQRQDARRCWLKAYELDPNMAAVQQALDKHFPGWESQPLPPPMGGPGHATPMPGAQAGDAPPPPPPAFAAPKTVALSMETVAPVRHEAPAARPAATAHTMAPGVGPGATVSPIAPQPVPAPERAAEPLPDLDRAFETQVRGEPVLTRTGPPGTLPSFEIGPRGLSDARGKVNWRAILEEATEIAASGKK